MRALIALALVAACGGVEPTAEVDHGPPGNPRDSVGCQRDFCPSARLERISLHVDQCFCWCRPWDGPRPGIDYMMGFTSNPWPAERLPWAKAQWNAFCPNPQ